MSLSIFALFAGFIIPKESIPIYLIWLHYLSFFSYSLEALCIDQLQGVTFDCLSPKGLNQNISVPFENCTAVCYLNASTGVQTPGCKEYCPVTSGTDFLLTYFDMHQEMYYVYIDGGILLIIYLSFVFLTYLGVKYVSWLKK